MDASPDYFAQPERLAATSRSQEIRRLREYFQGTQYDGRPDFFTGETGSGEVVPLRERAPCIIYPLPKAACNQATRFTFGEGRFPSVAAAPAESEDDSTALAEDEAKVITTFLGHVIESSRLKGAMRRLLRIGLSQRTAVAVLTVQRGRFHVDMPRPEHCWAEFVDNDPEGEVVRMTWCYQFEKPVLRNDRVETDSYLFRRDYTATEIVFYEDAKVIPGKPPEWVRDELRTRPHNLGFCPVRWIRNLPAEDCADVDGVGLYDGLEDEFDALNLALSQRHRGITYFGTPQTFETGVGEDESPGETARTSRPGKASTSAAERAKDPYQQMGGEAARKKAPDSIWSYKNDKVRVDVLETTGKAFEVASKHVADVRSRLLEAMDVCLMDPSEVAGKGEMSAKALALLFTALLGLVDELRDCWWATGLAPLLQMVLRITVALGGKGILVPQARLVAEICKRFLVDFTDPADPAGPTTIWMGPTILASWGAYFSPTNEEVGELVDATVAARDGGLIGDATAKRNVASYFGEVDTDEDEDERKPPPATSSSSEKPHMNPLHMDLFDEDRALLLPSSMMTKIHVARLGELGGATVWAVNGSLVRGFDVDFELGANPGRYVYVPADELWVDQGLVERPADLAAVALHHAIESAIMEDGDVDHDCAHHAAEAMEKLFRNAFANGIVTAATPAEALAAATTWLPGLLGSARGLAATRQAAAIAAPVGAQDAAPNGARPGEPDPGSKLPGKLGTVARRDKPAKKPPRA